MAETGPAREQTRLKAGPMSISNRQEEKHESVAENALTLGIKKRVRQWLRTAAKEIGKSSLAWYVEMDEEPEEDRLTSFQDVVLRFMEVMREEKIRVAEQRRREEEERAKAEEEAKERARLKLEEKRRIAEEKEKLRLEQEAIIAKQKAEAEARAEAKRKIAEEKKKRALARVAKRQAAERRERKRKARELRMRAKAEREAVLIDIAASKELVRQMREQERLRLLALKQRLLEQTQARLRGGEFYERERAWKSVYRKPDITPMASKSRLKLPSIAASSPSHLAKGPAAHTKIKSKKTKSPKKKSTFQSPISSKKHFKKTEIEVKFKSEKGKEKLPKIASATPRGAAPLPRTSTVISTIKSDDDTVLTNSKKMTYTSNSNFILKPKSRRRSSKVGETSPSTNNDTLRVNTDKPPPSPITVPIRHQINASPIRHQINASPIRRQINASPIRRQINASPNRHQINAPPIRHHM